MQFTPHPVRTRQRSATTAQKILSSSSASTSHHGHGPDESALARLMATALQRLGIVDRAIDPASVTPAALGKLPLLPPVAFGAAVGVRTF